MGRATQRSARIKSNDAHPLSPAGDRTGMPCHVYGPSLEMLAPIEFERRWQQQQAAIS